MINKVLKKYKEEGLKGVYRAVRRKLYSSSSKKLPHHLVLNKLTKRKGYSVIQLGAFVGKTINDPLYDILCRQLKKVPGKLILVEPVKEYYTELVKNYEGIPGVSFENVAISDKSGTATFYRLGVDPVEHGYPDWLAQLSSLKEDRMGSLWDRYEQNPEYKEFYLKHRILETVNCITFQELAERHNLTSLDFLQMDVEGYEFEILKTINFEEFPVRFVNYENVLLHENKVTTENFMKQFGYNIIDHGQDTFCNKTEDNHLLKYWR